MCLSVTQSIICIIDISLALSISLYLKVSLCQTSKIVRSLSLFLLLSLYRPLCNSHPFPVSSSIPLSLPVSIVRHIRSLNFSWLLSLCLQLLHFYRACFACLVWCVISGGGQLQFPGSTLICRANMRLPSLPTIVSQSAANLFHILDPFITPYCTSGPAKRYFAQGLALALTQETTINRNTFHQSNAPRVPHCHLAPTFSRTFAN